MSPSPPPGVAGQLRQLIHYNLDNGLYSNALFLAGRLHALDPRNQDSIHMLALCNLRLGRYKAAYDCARPKSHQSQHLGCTYVFALACLALERYEVGATALEKVRGYWMGRSHWNKHSDTARRHVPDAAACSCLLGKLWDGYGDIKKAVDAYIESLTLNPFMWDAFTALCDIGAVVRPPNIFRVTPEMLTTLSQAVSNGDAANHFARQDVFNARNPFVATPDNDPFNPSASSRGDLGLKLGGSNLFSKLNSGVPATNGHPAGAGYPDVETPPSNNQNIHDEDVTMSEVGGPVSNEPAMDILHAPLRKGRLQPLSATEEPPKMRPITSRTRLKPGSESADATDIPRPIGQNGHKRTVSGHSTHTAPSLHSDPTAAPPRRSTRILNSIRPSSSRLAAATSRDPEARDRREMRKAKATGTKGKMSSSSTVGRVVSGNRKPPIEITEASGKLESRPASAAAIAAPPQKVAPPRHMALDRESLDWLLALLLNIGTGYAQLSRFQCTQALETFATIPAQQRETPWVLTQIGKAYYERTMYEEAEQIFKRIRDKAPSHLDDMEYYSSALWFLKKETDVAHLAHTLVEQDRLSPQAWCALGNAFSLQRDHDQAIKCFSRAIQLDPKFAYAYTLQGFEHIANDEYDKAMFAYRSAIGANSRHYVGWFGLGQVYENMGKYDVAERHYRAAVQINPTNAALAVKIGVVLDRMKKYEPALVQFMAAIAIDPKHRGAHYYKAQIHLKLGAPVEALKELQYLKDVEPTDSSIHFALAKTYKKLRDRPMAVRHFTIALNLDPKAQNTIKEAMENIDEDEDEGGGWSSDDE